MNELLIQNRDFSGKTMGKQLDLDVSLLKQ